MTRLKRIKASKHMKVKDAAMLNRAKTACFTGHGIFIGLDNNDRDPDRYINIKKSLRQEAERAIKNGYDTFLCGLIKDFDLYCIETVLELKSIYPHIKIFGVYFSEYQQNLWFEEDKLRYEQLEKQLDGAFCIFNKVRKIVGIRESFAFLVDNSSLNIALSQDCEEESFAVKYSKKSGVQVVIV